MEASAAGRLGCFADGRYSLALLRLGAFLRLLRLLATASPTLRLVGLFLGLLALLFQLILAFFELLVGFGHWIAILQRGIGGHDTADGRRAGDPRTPQTLLTCGYSACSTRIGRAKVSGAAVSDCNV